MNVAEKVKEILVEELCVAEDKVTEEARLIEDLGADSLDSIGIIIEIEKEFNIEISDAQVEEIKTVRDLISAVEKVKACNE